MDFIKLIVQIPASVLGCLAALLSITIFFRLRWPAPALWLLKLYVSALSPIFVLIGSLGIIAGLSTGSTFISAIGIFNVLVYSIHIFLVTRPGFYCDFEKVFGPRWETFINAGQKNHFLPNRFVFRLPAVLDARLEQNISFATISGTDRQLLCDVWQPNENIIPSGLALIYLHGSAWHLLDKDFGTRPFFSHLAEQGHVIMDVAYRLAPESDMMGMVNDVKRAIIWMKENATVYGIDPDKVVVSGGSAGAHLALLAAYTATNQQFTPKELEGKNLSVGAVISLYGPTDLVAMYYHTNQHLTTRLIPGQPRKKVSFKLPHWIIKKMGENYHRLGLDKDLDNGTAFVTLLGGHPDDCPEAYALFSPLHHIHTHCPPTLLIQGAHDLMVPVKSTRFLYNRLLEEHVPTMMHILPQTDHAFDLQLPVISPSAHSAIYDVERFLAGQLISPDAGGGCK